VTREALAEPRRVMMALAVTGLLLGGRTGLPWALVAALVAVVVARHAIGLRGALAIAGVACLLTGTGFAARRTAVLDRTALTLSGDVAGNVTLLEAFRRDAEGAGSRALGRFRDEPVLIRVPGPPPPAPIGAILALRGRLKPPDRAARARHAHATVIVGDVRVTGRRRGGLPALVDGIRSRALAALSEGVPPEEAALLSGMVLGQDAALPLALQDDMRTTSLSHLTAASGSNVALLAALASGLGILLGFGIRGRWLLALALTALYVPLAGGGASITRAGIMGGAALITAMAGRPASRADALLVAALLTLLLDPRSAGDLGWQLSFAAVVGIAVLAARVGRLLHRVRIPRAAAQVCAVTIAATVTTAPILALRVRQVSPLAVPANILAAPAVPLVMGLGAAAATVGQLSTTAAEPLAVAAAVPAAYVAAVGHRLAQVHTPAVFGGTRPPPLPSQTLRVTALDIGQGDATLLEAAGARVLVDTGPPGRKLQRQLAAAGVRRLDVLVLTHSQLDHIGEAAELLDGTPTGVVLDGRGGDRSPLSRSIDRPLALRRPRLVAAAAGQQLVAGGLRLRVLWPPAGRALPGGDPNDRAIVLVAEAYGHRVLLTADAESNVLAPLRLPTVDLLKVSHHGSADSGLQALLQRLRPRLAVIEVGKHNSYGHPTRSTLTALAAARVPVVRTDQDGMVRIELGPAGLHVARRAGP